MATRLHLIGRRRGGAAAVEMALVLPVLLLFMFGIFEYGRFVFFYTTITNAVRDGCRYAIVNTTSTKVDTDVKDVVLKKMGGVQNNMRTYTINVMYADPTASGLGAATPILQDYGAKPMPNGWKSTPFPDKIAVQLTGVYYPVMAWALKLPATIPVTVSALMTSEQ